MGLLDSLYRVVMRRNAVYVTFVVAGAFAGERVVDYGVHKIWEMNNLGVTFLPQLPFRVIVLLLSVRCHCHRPISERNLGSSE
ncbi:Ubiquinol-cytochrome c reductase complex 8.0 kDa protein [Zea mays]|uniref:Complex III subunit 9 n=1 Tax=Zea mays TaxID=4577 RepID=A0A1D6EIK2_MAIZE|nr:Ubiquinol-cytochrome c reductase complex 8.0 kDa protein [Zea mays]